MLSVRKHSDPFLYYGGGITYAGCACGWERWYRSGPAGATIGWALHIARAATTRG